jgi:Fibronectin type III domain
MRRLLPVRARHLVTALILLTAPAVGLLRAVDAATVTVEWASNGEANLAGYLVSYGTQPGQLTDTVTVDVGNHTSYQVTDLETGRTYFFVVQAYNATRLVSAPSEEVSATIGVAPLRLTTFMTSLASPQPPGTTVIFAAAASGGVPPYRYKWFVMDGAKATIARDWSGDNTFTWRPEANAGYVVKAWARSATSLVDAPEGPNAERSASFAITSADATLPVPPADSEPLRARRRSAQPAPPSR